MTKLGMATVSLGGGLADKIAAISAAGFDGIELVDADLRESGMSPSECALRCTDAGLSVDVYQPFRRAEGVSAVEFRDVVERFHRELGVARELGASSVMVVSNTDTDADGHLGTSVDQVATLGEAAAAQGITLMFEALAWGTHVNTVAGAWEVVRSTGHPNVRLVVDTFHHLARGEDLGVLDELPSGSVGFLQLADAPVLDLDLLTWSRNHRCFPGEGGFDLADAVAKVLATGYDGPVSLEIFHPRYRQRAPRALARTGATSLRRLAADLDGSVSVRSA